jgi:biopolymer transport protein ExbB
MEVLETLNKGGAIVYILLFASVLSLTVFIERFWATSRRMVCPPALRASLFSLLAAGRLDAAQAVAASSHTPAATLAAQALSHRSRGRTLLRERLESEGASALHRLRRGLGVLAATATVSPLLGLLGTVLGMVQVFQAVERSTEPQISDLAGGIWVALLTTVAGLAVAIPAYIAHRYLESRLEAATETLESFSEDLLDSLTGTRDTDGRGLDEVPAE